MIEFFSENLIHFFFGGLWLLFFGCIEVARRAIKRERLVHKGLKVKP